MKISRTSWRASRFPTVLLLVSVLATVLSLASLVSTQAMPVEARTTEPWYAYQTSVGFDFTAHVKAGKFYTDPVVKPDQLMKDRGPVEPPVYRRVLISKFTDTVEVKVPYSYKADRPATLNVKWRVDGMVMLPGIWQKPYPLLAQKEFTVQGAEVSGVETFEIPIAKFLADMEENRVLYGIQAEPYELHISPVLEVEAAGLKEPVSVSSTGEFLITLRQTTVEVDDPKAIRSEKNFAETKIVPITVSVLGSKMTVGLVRQISIVALVVFLLVAIAVAWTRRKKPDNRAILQKLGANLITARAFELPDGTAVVDVRTARELVQLQTQCERPVIKVGATYYLQDGNTCYRLTVTGEKEGTD